MKQECSLSSRLRDRDLLRTSTLVAGRWRGTDEVTRQFEVSNPSTGSVIAAIPDLGPDAVREAIDVAYAAQKKWAAVGAKDRAAVLRRLYDLIVANCDDLAAIVVAEMGKPFAEARAEVLYGASYAEWYAEQAKRLNGDVLPGHQADKRNFVIRQPVGVVAGITAWNFPSAMPMRKIAPALAAGCAMVFKPSEQTPLSAIALCVLAERAGVPAGLLSLITTTEAPGFGEEVCRNSKVRKLTFTGSTEVGRILMRQASSQILKLSLELGGNAPFIVFNDADLDAAVEGALQSKFRAAGQTCVCANRIFVQRNIHGAFSERLAERVKGLRVGDGFDPESDIGPLVDAAAATKVLRHIQDAVDKGAEILAGGAPLSAGSLFFAPTVLKGVTPNMLVAREETFGPLAPIFAFDTEEDVIALANDTEFGLASYFFTRDVDRAWRVAEALEYGMVGVNTGLISTEIAPFGGVKQSGIGREGSIYGLHDFTEMKYLSFAIRPA